MMAEPWLREIDLGIDAALQQPLFALEQVREDLVQHTSGIPDEQVWVRVHGLTPLGFHLRHIAGSTRRLTAYLRGEQLTDQMLLELREEQTAGPTLRELLSGIEAAILEASQAIRALDGTDLGAPRFIGRRKIRTTAIGLAIHIGEHAQRHTGQAIVLCRLLQAVSRSSGS